MDGRVYNEYMEITHYLDEIGVRTLYNGWGEFASRKLAGSVTEWREANTPIITSCVLGEERSPAFTNCGREAGLNIVIPTLDIASLGSDLYSEVAENIRMLNMVQGGMSVNVLKTLASEASLNEDGFLLLPGYGEPIAEIVLFSNFADSPINIVYKYLKKVLGANTRVRIHEIAGDSGSNTPEKISNTFAKYKLL